MAFSPHCFIFFSNNINEEEIMELINSLHKLKQHLIAMGFSPEIGLIKDINKQLERLL